jgi:hypothetical protein
MSSFTIREVPPGLVRRARERAAAERRKLNEVMVEALVAYADGKTSRHMGLVGGRARAAALTAAERAAIARNAAVARWSR